MGVSTAEIFGTDAAPQPALPGSYGQAPSGYRLPDATRLGHVVLQVRHLERSLAFYEGVLGFRVVQRDADTATLAAQDDDRPLVRLEAREGIAPSRRGRLGLYHFAILLPDRAALGRFVQHLADLDVRAGAGDHRVSEAFYLADPDGLGIEVYADRPRDTWQRLGRELVLATDPIGAASIVASAGGHPWTGMPAGTVIGHVHLHVGNLERAQAFYGDGVGFDRMTWSYPGALFLGAGGYHHHLGTNLWAGPLAQPAADDEARLLEWTIEVPAAHDVRDVSQSLLRGGFAVEAPTDGSIVVGDPWGTKVRITTA
ncbi:MAG: glyoxalase [Gemmatimonas sp.]|nr:glyoxalase [Gemmatimonas sp.]